MNKSFSTLPVEIDCGTVKTMLEQEEEFLLLDCRTHDEYNTVHLEAAKLIPMEELPKRISELTPYQDRRIVVHCHLGGRSLQVTEWLRSQGFTKTQNMSGGIDAWAREVDSSLSRY